MQRQGAEGHPGALLRNRTGQGVPSQQKGKSSLGVGGRPLEWAAGPWEARSSAAPSPGLNEMHPAPTRSRNWGAQGSESLACCAHAVSLGGAGDRPWGLNGTKSPGVGLEFRPAASGPPVPVGSLVPPHRAESPEGSVLPTLVLSSPMSAGPSLGLCIGCGPHPQVPAGASATGRGSPGRLRGRGPAGPSSLVCSAMPATSGSPRVLAGRVPWLPGGKRESAGPEEGAPRLPAKRKRRTAHREGPPAAAGAQTGRTGGGAPATARGCCPRRARTRGRPAAPRPARAPMQRAPGPGGGAGR